MLVIEKIYFRDVWLKCADTFYNTDFSFIFET